MPEAPNSELEADDGIVGPLRQPTFRRIWAASLLSNIGSFILGVGVAWAMTQMDTSPGNVALVQTALGLPVVLISLLAGAVADVHDRRVVTLVSLGIALGGSAILTILASIELLTPSLLLLLCFAVGSGNALMAPAWQSAVSEQVPAKSLPAAVALNSVSYNIARSVGPAIGGLVVATAGTVAAFALNSLFYLPLIIALWSSNRVERRSRLPPEPLGGAMLSGVRYIAHSASIKILLVRSLVTGAIGGAITALMPLVAGGLLQSGARTFGLLFSAFGVGAVLGAINIGHVRARMSNENAIRVCAAIMGSMIAVVALSREPFVTAVALLFAGAAWTMSWTLFGVGVQLSVPRWVVGRGLAAYQAASWGGLAFGSWGWGHLTDLTSVETALLTAAGLMLLSPVLGLWLRMPPFRARGDEAADLEDPAVRLPLSGSDGPLVIEIEYRVRHCNSRKFYDVMQEVQFVRRRNGAYGWSLAQDIADPELWTERFHCTTWHEYLRQRNRSTKAERALEKQAIDLHLGPDKTRVRRMIERPFG